MGHAYQHAVLDEDLRPLTTINTSKGLFVFQRLPFSVSYSPGKYRWLMEQLLHDIHMTVVYLDDILLTGRTPEEHDRDLATELTRLQSTGLRLKNDTCAFRQKSCTYVGHVIDAEGINVVQWYSMRLVCIAGYCLNSSFNATRATSMPL